MVLVVMIDLDSSGSWILQRGLTMPKKSVKPETDCGPIPIIHCKMKTHPVSGSVQSAAAPARSLAEAAKVQTALAKDDKAGRGVEPQQVMLVNHG